jgi:hypothetical protein
VPEWRGKDPKGEPWEQGDHAQNLTHLTRTFTATQMPGVLLPLIAPLTGSFVNVHAGMLSCQLSFLRHTLVKLNCPCEDSPADLHSSASSRWTRWVDTPFVPLPLDLRHPASKS